MGDEKQIKVEIKKKEPDGFFDDLKHLSKIDKSILKTLLSYSNRTLGSDLKDEITKVLLS